MNVAALAPDDVAELLDQLQSVVDAVVRAWRALVRLVRAFVAVIVSAITTAAAFVKRVGVIRRAERHRIRQLYNRRRPW